MAAIDYTDALGAGWRIFPLHDILHTPDGKRCGCLDPDCPAIGKHPRSAAWQHTQDWDETQLEYLEDFDGVFFGNQLLDGYGIVVKTSGLLVVDVDGRNGGFETAKELEHIRDQAAFIVRTGSGNGEHWYFKVPADWQDKPLSTTLHTHKGVDFKSTGYVVGSYSEHASGLRYEAIKGTPKDVTEAPLELLQLLERKERKFNMGEFSVDEKELAAMIDVIPNSGRDYEHFIRIGMGLHDATGGSDEGYQLWLSWSSKGDCHDERLMPMKWHSFGKGGIADPVTAGYIAHHARENGYKTPVEFVDDTEWEDIEEQESTKVITTKPKTHNLLSPPGIVGELTSWINMRCAFPREKLAVAAALQIVSNAAGLNYLVAGRNTSINLITLAIAGSRTGKGAIKRCIDEAHYSLDLSQASHGKFKSSQELVRNAIHHQMIAYVYDEFGKQLEKISGAGRGGAHYLEDLLAELIAMYSEATGIHGLSGDLKREMGEIYDKEIAREIKKLGLADDENPMEIIKEDPDSDLARAFKRRADVERGIVEPYLSFFGMSEPTSFNAAVDKDPWLITGGFLGRALIFEEEETVPLEKDPGLVTNDPMPELLAMRLRQLSTAGSCTVGSNKRVERVGDWQYIEYAPCGEAFFKKVRAYWHDAAIMERDNGSGLESQALGATELTIKVAGILAAETKLITELEASWAHELIRSITHEKIERARANENLKSRAPSEKGSGLLAAIMRHMRSIDEGSYTTAGRARQSAGRDKVSLEDTIAALNHLSDNGKIRIKQGKAGNGREVTRYYNK